MFKRVDTHKSSSVSGSLSFFFFFLSGVYTTPSRKKSFKQPIFAVAPRTPNRSVTPLRFQSYLLDATEVWRPQGGLRKYISPREGGNRPTIFYKKLAYFFHIHVEGDMDLMYIYIYVVRERCYHIYCMCSRCWMICRFPKSNISKLCCQAKDGNLQWLQGGAPLGLHV